MNFICGVVSRTPPQPRLKNFFRFYRHFQRGWKRRSAIISFNAITVVNLLGGRFAFIMFIQMFMLILWFTRAGCSLFRCVCVLTFVCVGGQLKSADKLKGKMLSNEHCLGSCRL